MNARVWPATAVRRWPLGAMLLGIAMPLGIAPPLEIATPLASVARAENWPCWRGPRGDGGSHETGPPTRWNGVTGENIAWKVPLASSGHSSPIVWNDHVFVTGCDAPPEPAQGAPAEAAAAPVQPDRVLIALRRGTGETLWRQTVLRARLEKKHNLNSHASGTPATDGKLVYVSFLEPDADTPKDRTPGEMVVAAYDFAGQQKWLVRPGRFASVHGFCSSPVLFENLVIVNGDHDGDAYIVALDRDTGETKWKVSRKNKTRSYVTPIIREMAGRTQMILSGSKSVVSLNPRTGEEHWRVDGPTEQFVASMVDDGKLVFLTAGFPQRHVLAIRPDGSGDVTASHIVWRNRKAPGYVPSPVVCGEYFLVASDEGVVTCYQPATGETYWAERLGKHYSASLATADGLVYLTEDAGLTKIVRPGAKLDVVAENPLGEYCHASVAISQGQLFFRGEKHLFCVGVQPK